MSEHDTERVEKFVPSPEIRALNDHIKYCMIQCYYTTGSALTVRAACMMRLANTNIIEMYLVRKHDRLY